MKEIILMTYTLKRTIKIVSIRLTNRYYITPSSHSRIKRACLQCYLWLHAGFVEFIEINPLDYGYELTEDDMLVPTIIMNM